TCDHSNLYVQTRACFKKKIEAGSCLLGAITQRRCKAKEGGYYRQGVNNMTRPAPYFVFQQRKKRGAHGQRHVHVVGKECQGKRNNRVNCQRVEPPVIHGTAHGKVARLWSVCLNTKRCTAPASIVAHRLCYCPAH